MNVFDLASQYRQLEALVDADSDVPEADLVEAWMSIEGDFNHKLENLGFAIRNRQATLAGIQEALQVMEARAVSTEKEIERLTQLALKLMAATNHKKAGGSFLTLSMVNNKPKVVIEEGAKLSPEYMRTPEPKPPVPAPDKNKLYEDLAAGVVVAGARLEPSVRLSIK